MGIGPLQVGAHHLGWVVNENQALEELQLGWNRLFFRGGAEIAAGLRNNSCLKALDVRSNGLKDKGAAYFGNALVENKTLTSIDLSGNSIRSGGCLVLAEAIQNNSTLTTLLLNDNPLGGEGGNHLLIALAENKTLTRFGIQGSSFVDVHGPPASSDRGDAREVGSCANRPLWARVAQLGCLSSCLPACAVLQPPEPKRQLRPAAGRPHAQAGCVGALAHAAEAGRKHVVQGAWPGVLDSGRLHWGIACLTAACRWGLR